MELDTNVLTLIVVMAAVIGFICNYFVKAVNSRFHMTSDHPANSLPGGRQAARA